MNKRIQELVKQAHVTETKKVRKGGWDNDREPYEYHDVTETKFSHEKFAELIVLERIRVILEGDYQDTADPIFAASEDIRKHFGVD